MKRIFLSMLALGLATLCWAQKGDPFCCITPGTELRYETLNAKGKSMKSSTVTSIDAVTGYNGNYTITQTSSSYSDGQLVMAPIKITSEVVDGSASIALSGGSVMDVSSDIPLLPADLYVGKDLGIGTVVVKTTGISVTQVIESNKVIAQEEVTTPAGTFDCYVVEQVSTTVLGPIKVKGTQKIYYSRGVGTVKILSYDKKGKLGSQQVLSYFGPKQ